MLILATPPPGPPAAATVKATAQAVFTCANTTCKRKPSTPCVYTSGAKKNQPRTEGPHSGRLLAATEHLTAVAALQTLLAAAQESPAKT